MKALGLVLAVVLLAASLSCGDSVEKRLAVAAERQKEIFLAVHSLWIDDCSGLKPESGVDLPTRLTTPVAYIGDRRTMQDPFSKEGETFLYVPNTYWVNSGTIAVISRGPDGILEAAELPQNHEYTLPLFLPVGYLYTSTEWNGMKQVHPNPQGTVPPVWDANRYRDESGEWHEAEYVVLSAPILPSVQSTRENPNLGAEAALEWLALHGVHQYDPTNGARSRGDVIFIK